MNLLYFLSLFFYFICFTQSFQIKKIPTKRSKEFLITAASGRNYGNNNHNENGGGVISIEMHHDNSRDSWNNGWSNGWESPRPVIKFNIKKTIKLGNMQITTGHDDDDDDGWSSNSRSNNMRNYGNNNYGGNSYGNNNGYNGNMGGYNGRNVY